MVRSKHILLGATMLAMGLLAQGAVAQEQPAAPTATMPADPAPTVPTPPETSPAPTAPAPPQATPTATMPADTPPTTPTPPQTSPAPTAPAVPEMTPAATPPSPTPPNPTPPPEGPLKHVASFTHQVTGVTVEPGGRIFVNFPRWTEDSPVSVAELLPDGTLRPYPDEGWNAWRNARANELSVADHFVCVQSVVADGKGNLWVLDPAAPGNERVLPNGPKLVQIDLATDQVVKVIPFGEDVALQGSYLNDVRFSPDGRIAYITDSGTRGAIIVVNLHTGGAWRLLDGHPSTQVERDVTVQADGAPLKRPDQRSPTFAADGIALSADGRTLYWQALTGQTLYSIDTQALRTRIPPRAVERQVQTVGRTTVADGLWLGQDGTLYVTSPQDGSIKAWRDGQLRTVLQDPRLRWPDTMSEGADGMLYVTASHIQDSAWFKPGAPIALPTELFRFSPVDAR